jgi:sporulation protein YlmC with PRC-barrel domain
MSERTELDLALRVLDQQVVDWSGRRCGNVDDVAIDGEPGASASVRGLLVGRDAAKRRRPRLLSFFAGPTFGDKPEVEVPWSAIEEITQVVKLKEDASEFGLGAGDDRIEKWLRRIPRSS